MFYEFLHLIYSGNYLGENAAKEEKCKDEKKKEEINPMMYEGFGEDFESLSSSDAYQCGYQKDGRNPIRYYSSLSDVLKGINDQETTEKKPATQHKVFLPPNEVTNVYKPIYTTLTSSNAEDDKKEPGSNESVKKKQEQRPVQRAGPARRRRQRSRRRRRPRSSSGNRSSSSGSSSSSGKTIIVSLATIV